MPDFPPGGGQPPAQGPAPGGAPQGGGGITDALASVDQTLTKIAQAVAQSQQLPNDVKSAAQDALSAFRSFEQALIKAAGGGGDEPDGDEGGQGATTPQQGGNPGAVPLSHQSMRGK